MNTYKTFRVRHPDGGSMHVSARAYWNGRAWLLDYEANGCVPAYASVPKNRSIKVTGKVYLGVFLPTEGTANFAYWPQIKGKHLVRTRENKA